MANNGMHECPSCKKNISNDFIDLAYLVCFECSSKLREPIEEDSDNECDDANLFDTCPNCSVDYDEVDHEFQICHHCGFSRNN